MVNYGLRIQGNNAIRVALELGLQSDSDNQAKIATLQTYTLENSVDELEYIRALMAVVIIIRRATGES